MAALCGCTTLGGNVKGSFSCAAPDGICAPSSSIDDRALATIAGESGATEILPARPVSPPESRSRRGRVAATGQRVPLSRADPQRTQERVLRIVFQPYIDEFGRLHEASAVHAVVEDGTWQQQRIAAASSNLGTAVADLPVATGSLAAALDRTDGPGAALAAIDPNLPDPAVVAAARARAPAADPVAAIRNDVAARLAPKVGRTPPRVVSKNVPAPLASKPGGMAPPPAVAEGASVAGAEAKTVARGPATAAPPAKTTSGIDAVARVKTLPEVQTRAFGAEAAARDAADAANKPTRRAAGFPAGVPEDN